MVRPVRGRESRTGGVSDAFSVAARAHYSGAGHSKRKHQNMEAIGIHILCVGVAAVLVLGDAAVHLQRSCRAGAQQRTLVASWVVVVP
jgi:hypothetical protein